MRIDNPISDNAIITGSFTGSFKGDGSQLTGITHPSIPAGTVSGSEQIVISDTTGYSVLAADVAANTAKISFDSVSSTKLAGIEASATGDQTGAEIKVAYEGEADTNAFTDAEKSKLAALEAGATGDQTGAEIKALYEGEADTNAFTDAASAKLAGIEAGATGDQSAAEILTAIKTVDGTGSGLDADLLDGQSAAYYATAASVATNTSDIATNTAAIATKATPADVTTAVNNLINGAGTAYDTLSELGAAITANDSDIATILTTQSGKLSKASNLSDLTDAAAARTNLGLGTAATTAATAYATAAQGALAATAHGWGNHASAGYLTSYTDTNTTYSAGSGITLTGTTFSLTTPITNNNQLTNGAGYITSYVNTTYSAGTGVTLTGTTFSIGQAVATTSNVTFGSVTASGNITAYSDARLKKDVKTIEGALAKTNSLRGVEYTRIADDAKSIGVIAQELEAVLPELVATDDEGMKSVNYAQITGLLIEAVKELSAKVDELSK